MRTLAVILGVILLVLATIYAYFSMTQNIRKVASGSNVELNEPYDNDRQTTPSKATEVPSVVLSKSYDNDGRGISFTYPNGYVLSDENISTGPDAQYTIKLVREADANPRKGIEGPPFILIAIYPKKGGLSEWLKDGSTSNYLQSAATKTTVAGIPAVSYDWSGIYEGHTVAFENNAYIVAATVTYNFKKDPQVQDFSSIVDSIQLYAPSNGDVLRNVTLAGIYGCVPVEKGQKNNECRDGLQTGDGTWYLLDLHDVTTSKRPRADEKVRVEGQLTPKNALNTDMWEKYDMKGIVRVISMLSAR